MKMKPFAAGITLLCLMLCVGCTPAPPAPAPVIVVNGDEQHALRLTAAAQVDYGEPLMVQSAKEAQA